MSLKARLALAFASVAVIVAALLGLTTYVSAAARLQAQADNALLRASGPAADHMHDDLPDHPFDGRPGGGPPGREDYSVQVLAGDGTLQRSASLPGDLPVDGVDVSLAAGALPATRYRTVEVAGSSYRVLTRGLGQGRGAVQVARQWSEDALFLRALRTRLLVLAALIAGLAAVGGWLLAGRMSARLVRLTGAAEHVSRTGRLDVAVPADGSDEVGRLAAAFNAMLVRLASSKADQQRLVQDAGHELRTPLTSLRTNVSLLGRFEELPAEARQRVVADLEGETRELTSLVNEIIDVAIDVPGDAEPELVRLSQTVATAVDRARRRSGREIELASDDSEVYGYRALLQRAVWNLLDNALKFDPGQDPIVVTVSEGTVSVADRGPGLADADIPYLFDRFYRATSTRSLPGSGLGLAIVRDVVEVAGGQVFADNRPGGGAVVGFTLPLAGTGR